MARQRSRALLASDRSDNLPLSSRGLGRRPLMAETRVRIPVAVLREAPYSWGFSRYRAPISTLVVTSTLRGIAYSSSPTALRATVRSL